MSIRLTHRPTGIQNEGTIPAGNYTKTEMKRKRKEMYAEVFQVLEQKVAKHLKIRGAISPAPLPAH